MRAALVLLSIAVLGLAAGCGGGTSDNSGTTGSQSTGSASAGKTTSAESTGCKTVDAPNARDPGSHEAPSSPLPAAKTYTLTFGTSCGPFTVRLDPKSAPHATASLVALARDGYFDDTIFHRVVPGFVIQGGDPTQTGSGGPGYSTVDVPPSDAAYTKGVVAMAKASAEPRGTSGSQFFVVTAADAALPPDYAIVGEVTKGMDTVERINALGEGDGPPSKPVVIDRVTVTER